MFGVPCLIFWGILLRRFVTAVILAASATLAGCAAEPPPVSAQVQKYYDEHVVNRPTVPVVKDITFAAYGDSITEGDSIDFAKGRFGPLSWASYVGEGIWFAGGWAQGGAKTAKMVENSKPLKADVLVLSVGANDYATRVPFTETSANIVALVKKSSVRRVLLVSAPPRDETPEWTVEYNRNLERLAAAQGWEFVDAAAGIRAGNVHADGMSQDGVHPTAQAARIMGAAIGAAIKP